MHEDKRGGGCNSTTRLTSAQITLSEFRVQPIVGDALHARAIQLRIARSVYPRGPVALIVGADQDVRAAAELIVYLLDRHLTSRSVKADMLQRALRLHHSAAQRRRRLLRRLFPTPGENHA